MNRRNFFRQLGGVAAAAVVAPIAAVLPKSPQWRYFGFQRRVWKGLAIPPQNLPRYIVQAASPPTLMFKADTDTGYFFGEGGSRHFVVAGRELEV